MAEYRVYNSWVGPYDRCSPCFYNIRVGCDKTVCESCGWNPFVSINRIAEKYGDKAVKYLTLPKK